MATNLDTTTLLGEDTPGPRHSLRTPRSLREAARAFVRDYHSQVSAWDEFLVRLDEAMKSQHRTFGSPWASASEQDTARRASTVWS